MMSAEQGRAHEELNQGEKSQHAGRVVTFAMSSKQVKPEATGQFNEADGPKNRRGSDQGGSLENILVQGLDGAACCKSPEPHAFSDDENDYRDEPVFTFCGSCKNHVMTNVSFKIGKLTIVSVGVLLMLGCVAGCCLVPLLWSRFRDVVHSCPNCQIKLGKFRRTVGNS